MCHPDPLAFVSCSLFSCPVLVPMEVYAPLSCDSPNPPVLEQQFAHDLSSWWTWEELLILNLFGPFLIVRAEAATYKLLTGRKSSTLKVLHFCFSLFCWFALWNVCLYKTHGFPWSFRKASSFTDAAFGGWMKMNYFQVLCLAISPSFFLFYFTTILLAFWVSLFFSHYLLILLWCHCSASSVGKWMICMLLGHKPLQGKDHVCFLHHCTSVQNTARSTKKVHNPQWLDKWMNKWMNARFRVLSFLFHIFSLFKFIWLFLQH